MTVTISTIGIGTVAEDKTGDPARTAFDKCNDNFGALKTAVEALQATGGADGNFNSVTVANDALTVDNEFVLDAQDATTPAIYFDDGDVFRYERGGNSFALAIGLINQLYVDSNRTVVSGFLEVNGNQITTGEANQQLEIAGGTTGSEGATITAYGPSHATKPNYIEIYGDRIGFFDASPVIKQNVPLTSPTVQNVIDALVALGLVEQSD